MPPPPTLWTVDDVKEFRAGDCRVQETTRVPDHLISKKNGFSRPRPLLRISRVVGCIFEDFQCDRQLLEVCSGIASTSPVSRLGKHH